MNEQAMMGGVEVVISDVNELPKARGTTSEKWAELDKLIYDLPVNSGKSIIFPTSRIAESARTLALSLSCSPDGPNKRKRKRQLPWPYAIRTRLRHLDPLDMDGQTEIIFWKYSREDE